MRYTNLEMVNKCLRVLREPEVSAIQNNDRGEEIFTVIEDVFHDMCLRTEIQSNNIITKPNSTDGPTATAPTRFNAEGTLSSGGGGLTTTTNLLRIDRIDYNKNESYSTFSTGNGSDSSPDWVTLEYKTPEEFLQIVDGYAINNSGDVDNADEDTVDAIKTFMIRTDKHPEFYTTFDNKFYYMDSYLNTIVGETTYLNSERVRLIGLASPAYTRSDSGYFPINLNQQQTLLREAQAMLQSIDTDGVNPKLEQQARKNRFFTQNRKKLIDGLNERPRYGRS